MNATREATVEEAEWVLGHLPDPWDPNDVRVTALCRDDGTAWFWVYPIDVKIGDVYVTWMVERTVSGVGTVGSFRSRRAERGDVTVP